MAKTDIVKVQPDLTLPTHLRDLPVEGMEKLKEFVVPSFLKIVQKQADDALLALFSPGDLVIMPQQVLFAAHNKGDPDSWWFSPIFFYTEYCVWAPLELKGQVPAVLERTLDPKSNIAMRAQNPDLRTKEDYEWQDRKLRARYVEHLNFIIAVRDHELGMEPMLLSFARGEHFTGTRFASLIKMRHASIYDCVFECRVSPEPRSNAMGSWYGFDIGNPVDRSPWNTEEEHETMKQLFDETTTHYQKGVLRADYGDEEKEVDEAAVEAASEF